MLLLTLPLLWNLDLAFFTLFVLLLINLGMNVLFLHFFFPLLLGLLQFIYCVIVLKEQRDFNIATESTEIQRCLIV